VKKGPPFSYAFNPPSFSRTIGHGVGTSFYFFQENVFVRLYLRIMVLFRPG
jgi:hypothetical protein